MGKPGRLLSAGELLALADRVRELRQEIAGAGFPTQAGYLNETVAMIEREAGARCVRELREQSHGREAA